MILSIKKSAPTFFVIIFFNTLSYGQYQMPDNYTQSPNAASIGTFGKIPISQYTGTPDINIPIYDLQQKEINLPINLSYAASGVHPDQHPSWTGLNWNLNAGGTITRIVKDMPDEFDSKQTVLKRTPYLFGTTFTGVEKGGYYFWRSHNAQTNWADSIRMGQIISSLEDMYDTEPDEYDFNFQGIHGKFFLSENGTWEVQSDENIKVIFEDQNFLDVPEKLKATSTKHVPIWCYRYTNIKSFGGFTLITDDGTKYIFGGNLSNNLTDAIEYSISLHEQYSDHWTATAWNLTKIITPNGNTIDLTYEPDNYITNMYISFLWYTSTVYNGSTPYCGGVSLPQGTGDNVTVDWITPKFASYWGSLIRPVYLKKIESANEKITFFRSRSNELKYDTNVYLKNKYVFRTARDLKYTLCINQPDPFYNYQAYNTPWPFLHAEANMGNYYNPAMELSVLEWKKLDSIQLQSKTLSTKGFQYNFIYNNNPSQRLFLNEIKKSSLNASNAADYSYKLDYNTGNLPAYFNENTDHWGFLTESTTKFFSAPRTYTFCTSLQTVNFDSLKKPTSNLNIAQIGSLKKITYPTGGETEFIYEQNNYSQFLNENRTSVTALSSNQIAGGLRIKKIISYNKADAINNTKEYFYVKGYTAVSNPSLLQSSGILGGQSKYFWSNYPQEIPNTLTSQTTIVSSQNVLSGSINSQGSHIGYSEVVEKETDGSYTISKFTNFTSPDGGKHFDELPVYSAGTSLSPYNSYTDKSFERGKIISKGIYNSLGIIVDSSKFDYQALSTNYIKSLSLKASIIQCFDNSILYPYTGFAYKVYCYKYKQVKEKKYFFSNIGSNYSLVDSLVKLYNTKGLVINITKTKSNGSKEIQENKYPVDFSGTAVYDSMIARNMNNPIILQKQYQDATLLSQTKTNYSLVGTKKLALPSTIQSAVLSNSLETRQQFNQFDTLGNLLEIQKVNDAKEVYVWGYKNQYPVAKIIGSDYNTVIALVNTSILNQPTDDAQLKTELNKIRNNFINTNVQIDTYTYGLFGITSQTNAANKTTYYEYDNIGRIAAIRDNDNNVIKTFTYNYQQ